MKRISKRNEISIIALSISLGMTVFFFSPYELLRCNQSEFLLYPQEIVRALVLTSVAGVLILFLLLNLFLLINLNAFRLIRSLLFGVLIGFYVQLLFFNGKMTVLNNDVETIEAMDAPSVFNIVNLLIMVAIYISPMIVTARQIDSERKGKNHREMPPNLIAAVALAVLLMQIAGAIQVSVNNKFIDVDTDYPKHLTYFSYSGVSNLSKEKNILVFVVDRMDGDWFDKTLTTYPELYDVLDGFTYYRDNVSRYSLTFPSVAQLLTGVEYNNESWKGYLSKAWNGNNVLEELKTAGFSVNVSIDSNTTYVSAKDVANYADNVVAPSSNEIEGGNSLYSINYLGEGGVIPVFVRYSLAKLVPYYYKSYFITSVGLNPAENFVVFKEQREDRQPNPISIKSDVAYNKYLRDVGITTENSKKNFSFIHLNGVHNPHKLIADLASDAGAAAEDLTIASARGSFETINILIKQLKDRGVYDNTAIIILGDHGCIPTDGHLSGNVEGLSPIMTTLLIKPFNTEHEGLKTDNTSPLSNQYIPATILEFAGIETDEYGVSVQDIIENGLRLERKISFAHFTTYFFAEPFTCTYSINGSARDINNWKVIQEGNNK